MRLCANVLSQHVIQTSLGGYQSVDELLIPGGRIYEQREFITDTVNAIPGFQLLSQMQGFTSSLRLTVTCMILKMMKNSVFVF